MDIGTKEVTMARYKRKPSFTEGDTLTGSGVTHTDAKGQKAYFGIETEYAKRAIAAKRARNELKSAEEVPLTRREVQKATVKREIASAQKRRDALKNMYQAEKVAENEARKLAVEEYKVFAAAAPAPETDLDGVLRAAYFNTELGKSVTDNLNVHIRHSMDKNQGAVQDPSTTAMEAGLTVGEDTAKDSVADAYQGMKEGVSAKDQKELAAAQDKTPPADVEVEVDGKKVMTTGNVVMVGGEAKVEVLYNDRKYAIDFTDLPKKVQEQAKASGEYRGSKPLTAIASALAAPFKGAKDLDTPGI